MGEHTTPASGPAPNSSQQASPQAPTRPVTLRTIRRMAASGEPFACLTAYDATTARWLERAGVPLLLVGDSAAEVVLGFERTIDAPLGVMIALTAAVKRGAPRTLVMADMPFLSYQADDAEAIRNAGRFLTEGGADIVKLEGDASFAPLVAKMARAGIAVCAHVGSKPQHSTRAGGYGAAGRTADEARAVMEDALALERAGATMLLVEAVPDEVGEELVRRASVPVIGIGAGPACHGQILVLHDLLGMTDQPPRFAEPTARLGEAIRDAASEWVRRVASRSIGGRRLAMGEGEAERFLREGRAAPGGEPEGGGT